MKRIVLVAVMIACGCLCSCRRAPEKNAEVALAPITAADSNSFIHVASIPGTADTADLVRMTLTKSKIRCILRGEAVYSVDVAPADKAKAVEVLAVGSSESGYPVSFD